MGAHIDHGTGIGGDGHERLVDESDYLVTASAQSHGDIPFVISDIGPGTRPLKDGRPGAASVVSLATGRGEHGDDPPTMRTWWTRRGSW